MSNIILFLADAHPSIGLGHIMRCLSIADAVAPFRQEVCFLLADDMVQKLVAGRGYSSIILNTAYNDLKGEMEKVSSIVTENKAGVLVVDSYLVIERYFNVLWNTCRSINCKLVYVDDVLAFPYPCDVLVNYNIYGTDADYKKLYKDADQIPTFLLGTSYAPLRKEFQNLASRMVRRQGRNILISTGGSDFEHITLALVEEICKRAMGDIAFHFIIGAMNEDRELIYDRAKEHPNIVMHENVKNMSTLMLFCDVAISAAGSTLYELCATQTPTITYILADNQISGAEGFERHGILQCAGDVRQLGVQRLAQKLLDLGMELCGSYSARCRIAEVMSKVVDGRGAERIAETIL